MLGSIYIYIGVPLFPIYENCHRHPRDLNGSLAARIPAMRARAEMRKELATAFKQPDTRLEVLIVYSYVGCRVARFFLACGAQTQKKRGECNFQTLQVRQFLMSFVRRHRN